VTVEVQAKAARHHDEPGGELGAAIGHVAAKAAAVVLPQALEHVRVTIHRRVVVGGERAGDMEEETAVRGDEVGPRAVSRAGV